MVQNGWGMAMDGGEKAGLWRSPWEARWVVGDEGTRRGHRAPRGLSPLLGAGQARKFGQGGDVAGHKAQMAAGRAVSGRKDRLPATSRHKRPWLWSLGGAGEARGPQQLWRGSVSDLTDGGQHQTGRSGHEFPLYYSCQGKTRPCRSERLGTGPW